MHKRKINRKTKRKGKAILVKIIVPLVLFLVILSGLYFFMPLFRNISVISPLASVVLRSDVWVVKSELYKNKISYSSVEIASDSSYLVILHDGAQVVLDSKKDITKQISSLQLMLNRLTIEGKRIKLIDLRFDRPIIRL